MTAGTEDYVGLTPDAQVEGGGLADDLDVEIVSARWVLYGYPNKAGVDTVKGGQPSLRLELRPIGDTKLTKPIIEHYSAGSRDRLLPSADGLFLKRQTPTAGLVKTTKAGIFCARAYELDAALTFVPPQGISQLDGRRCHVQRIPSPEYSNKTIGQRSSGRKDPGFFVITAFLKGGGASATAAAPGEDLDAETRNIILQILAGATKPLAKAGLSTALFRALDGHPQRQDITKRALVNDFLAAQAKDGFWQWDGAKLSALPEE